MLSRKPHLREDGMAQYGGRNPVLVGIGENEGFCRSEEHGEALLPGIVNDITFTHIVPKLSWTSFHTLSQASPFWRQAIQSHEVYNARIRSHVTETFVVICHTHPDRVLDETTRKVVHGISLYSLRDKSCFQLPAIPHLQGGIPRACQCITLDGKIYVLGGEKEPDEDPTTTGVYNRGSAEVYVMDVAGQREWKQCASMQKPRLNFGCGIIDGKIYVIAGASEDKAVHVSEVYDPKANAWSSILPMVTLRSHHSVSTLGEELFVHGGYYYGLEDIVAEDEPIDGSRDEILNLEVYHPGKNAWRTIAPKGLDYRVVQGLFLANGEFQCLQWNGIYVFEMDDERKKWTNLKPILTSPLGPSVYGPSCIGPSVRTVQPIAVKEVNGDYLVIVEYWSGGGEDYRTCLVQSKRIGPEHGSYKFGKRFAWEKVLFPLSFESLDTPVICPIQL